MLREDSKESVLEVKPDCQCDKCKRDPLWVYKEAIALANDLTKPDRIIELPMPSSEGDEE